MCVSKVYLVLVPFEITAFALVLTFWTDKIPVAAVVAVLILLYAALNVFTVKYFGEAEFWLASGKVLLILGTIAAYGNPQKANFN